MTRKRYMSMINTHNLQLVLNSMHKYQPRIHLVKRPDMSTAKPIVDLEKEPHKTFIFPEAIFTAVTAYQNQLVSFTLFLATVTLLSASPSCPRSFSYACSIQFVLQSTVNIQPAPSSGRRSSLFYISLRLLQSPHGTGSTISFAAALFHPR